MADDSDTAPGFYRVELAPEGAERLVLRFADADLSIAPVEGADLVVELELRGPREAVSAWHPTVRRIEGILVMADDAGPVKIAEITAKIPASLRDIEIHSRSGDIEVRDLPVGLLAETQSGSVRVVGASSLEARCREGNVETENTGMSDIVTTSGRVRAVRPEGRMTARTESGDIEVEESAADLYLESVTGEILISKPRGRIRVLSQAGDIELEAPENFGGGETNTQSGHIGLALAGASVELRAETLSGRLRTPSGEIGNNAGPRRAALSVSGGGRRLHAKSISGDIDIDF